MSQTEERVVVLEFDNKSFEQNTQQSIKTLENLDKSLANAGAANGLSKIGEAAKKIDLSGLANNVQNVSDRFSNMGIVGMTVIQNLTNSVVDLGKKAVGQMMSGGWTRAANIEKAKFQIEGLKGVWDETSKGYVEGMKTIKEAVNNAVDSTAYGLDEAAVIGSQLMASGITDANQLEEHLKSVSGLAAMTGGSYADIGRIYAQVAGQGRLMGNQLLQISQRGINVAATMKDYANANTSVRDALLEVAKASGKNSNAVNDMIDRVHKGAELTESDIRDLVSTGVVSFEFFSAAMGDAFAEHAKDANKTFDGALANMKAALNRIGAEFATPLRENLRDIFNALTPVINNIKTALMPIITVIVKAGKAATKVIVKILNVIAKATAPIEAAAKSVKKATKPVEDAGKAVKKVSGILTISKKEAKAAFDIWNKGTYGNGRARVKALRKEGLSYKNVQTYVNTLIKYNFDMDKVNKKIRVSNEKVTKTLKDQTKQHKKHRKERELTKEQTEAILKHEKYNKIAKEKSTKAAIEQYKQDVKELKLKEKKRQEEEKEKRRAEILISIQNALRISVVGLLNVGKGLVNIIKTIGSVVKSILSPLFKALWSNGNKLLVKFLSWSKRFSDATGRMAKAFQTHIGHKIQDVMTKVYSKIGNFIGGIRSWLKENQIFSRTFDALGTILYKVGKYIKEFFSSMKEYFQNNEKGKKTAEVFKKIWEYVKEMAKGALTKVVDDLERLSKLEFKAPDFSKVASIFGGGGGGGKFSEIISKVKDGGITGIFGDLFGSNEAFAATSSNKDPIETIKTFAGKLGDSGTLLASASDTLGKAVDTASDSAGFISKTGTKFTEAMTSFDWDRILKGGWEVAKIYAVIKGTNAAFKLTKSIGGVFGAISSAIAPYAGILNAIKKNIGLYSKAKVFETFAIGIGVLAGAMYILSKIPGPQAAKAAFFMEVALWSVIGSMVALSKTLNLIATTGLAKIGVSFLLISTSMFLLAGAMKTFAAMTGKTFRKGMGSIAALLALFVFAGKIQSSVLKGGASFAGMALAVDLLIPALFILSKVKAETVIKGGAAIMILMTELALASRIAKESVKNAASMVAMAIAVDLLVPAIVIMALIPFGKAMRGALVVGAVILAVATAARAAGNAKLSSLLSMTAAITILCGTIVILALLPAHKAIIAGAAISAVLITLSITIKQASSLANPKGILILISIVASIAFLFSMLTDLPIDQVIAIGASLSIAMLSLSGAVAILAAMGAGGPASLEAAATGIIALDLFIANLIAVLIALGGINEIPGVRDLLRGGGQIFGLIGEALGNFVGSIVSGFGKAVASGLPYMGEQFSSFMEKLGPGLDKVSKIDPKVGSTIKNLASSIALLTGSSFLDSINIFSKEDKISDFGEQLNDFIDSLDTFIDSAQDISEEDVETVNRVAKLIKALASAADEIPPSGGALQLLAGNTTIAEFAEWLPGVATNIADAINELPKVKGGGYGRIDRITEIFKALGKVAADIPSSEGFVHFFTGNTTIEDFAQFLAGAAPEIKKAIEKVNEITDYKEGSKRLIASADIFKALGKVADDFPPSEGFAQFFEGNTTIEDFAQFLAGAAPEIGNAITEINKIKNFKDGASRLEAIAPVLKALGEAANGIPKFTWNETKDDNKIKEFAEYLHSAMPSIASAANTLSDSTAEDVAKLCDFLTALAALAKVDVEGFDATKFDGLIDAIGSEESGLGPAIASFCKSIEGISTDNLGPVADFITKLSSLAESAKGFEPSSFNGIIQTLGGGSISVLGGAVEGSFGLGPAIANFCSAISGASTKNLGAISKVIDAVIKAAGNATGVSYTGLLDLADDLPKIATKLKNFSTSLKGFKGEIAKQGADVLVQLSKVVEVFQKFTKTGRRGSGTQGSFDDKSFDSFTRGLKKLGTAVSDFAKEMAKVEVDGLDEKANTIKSFVNKTVKSLNKASKKMNKAGSSGINNFIKGFDRVPESSGLSRLPTRISNAIGLSKFTTEGEKAGENFIKGFKKAKAKAAGEYIRGKVGEGVNAGGSLYTIGGNVGQGFVDGIRSKSDAAYRAGVSLYNQAKQAIKDKGKVNSPAKDMMPVGSSISEGLVVGMLKYKDEVYSTGEKVATYAMDGVKDNYGTDFTNPVIRPVLDLSDVRKGASHIDGMFGTTSINPQLVPQIQNRQNGASESEVFKNAVDKMSNTIVNSQKTNNSPTYNIGDVTLEVGDLKDVLTLDQFVAVIKKAKAFS